MATHQWKYFLPLTDPSFFPTVKTKAAELAVKLNQSRIHEQDWVLMFDYLQSDVLSTRKGGEKRKLTKIEMLKVKY